MPYASAMLAAYATIAARLQVGSCQELFAGYTLIQRMIRIEE